MEKVTDGSHTRFATTNDFKNIAEKESGKDLDWYFDVYLHQPLLPELNAEIITPAFKEFKDGAKVDINGNDQRKL